MYLSSYCSVNSLRAISSFCSGKIASANLNLDWVAPNLIVFNNAESKHAIDELFCWIQKHDQVVNNFLLSF